MVFCIILYPIVSFPVLFSIQAGFWVFKMFILDISPAPHTVTFRDLGQGRFMSEIYGTDGTIFVRPLFSEKPVALVKKGKTEFPAIEEIPFGVRHHQVFVDDILNDTYDSASVDEGLEVLRVIEANYESAMKGGIPVVL